MENKLENYDQEIRRIRGIEFPQMEGKFITNLVRILWCGLAGHVNIWPARLVVACTSWSSVGVEGGVGCLVLKPDPS